MKKITFAIFLILVFVSSGFARTHTKKHYHGNRHVVANPVRKVVIDTIVFRKDTVDPKYVVISFETLLKINKDNAELRSKIEGVQNENDKRVTTILWGVGIIVTLLITLVVAGAYRANLTAREAAKEEFDKEFAENKNRFKELMERQEEKVEELTILISTMGGGK